jgi:polyisoprenoid-binding protein YceI
LPATLRTIVSIDRVSQGASMPSFPIRLRSATLLSLALLLCSCSLLTPSVETRLQDLRSGQYQIDKKHVSLIFKIGHMNLSTFVGRFNEVDATLDFDPANVAATRLDANVNVASVDVNNPDLEESLRGSSWFDTKQYPQATFTTLKVEPKDGNTFRFAGNLTLHGVTAPVTLDVTFHGGATNMLTSYYTLGFSATGTIKRSVFGMDSYIPMIGDDVALEVYAEFQKK